MFAKFQPPFFFGTHSCSLLSSHHSTNLREAQHSDTENQSEVETEKNFKARSHLVSHGSAHARRWKMYSSLVRGTARC